MKNSRLKVVLATSALLTTNLALTIPVLAGTMEDVAAAMAKCDAIGDASKKLACFEAAYALLKVEPEIPVTTADPVPAAPVEAAPIQAAPSEAPDIVPPQAPTIQPAPTPYRAAPEAKDFGLETQISREKERKLLEGDHDVVKKNKKGDVSAIESKVLKTRTDNRGRAVITFANGQVWRFREADRVRFPKEEFMAKIRRGALGTFYLKFEGRKKAFSVERLK